MAFFDELGKRISQTSQGVVQKTKDAAETLKINGLISDEEKRINALFLEIGKAYFEIHADSCEPRFNDMISGIKEAQSKIEMYSEQVKRLKGIVRCPNCGGEVPYGAPFCSSCGSKMSVENNQNQTFNSNVRRCVQCGAPLSPDVAFCTNCGHKVESSIPVQDNPMSESSTQQQAPSQNTKQCPNCGKQISANAKFCIGCGAHFSE